MMSLKGLCILVAEDEPDLREIIVETFIECGAEVAGVSNGVEAWAELKKRNFDIFLSDVRMPGGDGEELVKRVSAELDYKPLLFLATGYSDLTIAEMQSYGVVEIFSKPFKLMNVIQVISEIVAKLLKGA